MSGIGFPPLSWSILMAPVTGDAQSVLAVDTAGVAAHAVGEELAVPAVVERLAIQVTARPERVDLAPPGVVLPAGVEFHRAAAVPEVVVDHQAVVPNDLAAAATPRHALGQLSAVWAGFPAFPVCLPLGRYQIAPRGFCRIENFQLLGPGPAPRGSPLGHRARQLAGSHHVPVEL
jgi:hypothetical protein